MCGQMSLPVSSPFEFETFSSSDWHNWETSGNLLGVRTHFMAGEGQTDQREKKKLLNQVLLYPFFPKTYKSHNPDKLDFTPGEEMPGV